MKALTKIEMVKAIAAHIGTNPTEDYLKKVASKKTLEQVRNCYEYANRTNDRHFAYVCLTAGIYE